MSERSMMEDAKHKNDFEKRIFFCRVLRRLSSTHSGAKQMAAGALGPIMISYIQQPPTTTH